MKGEGEGIHCGLSVGEIVALLPEAASLLAEYGLHCSGCVMGGMETLEDGCRIHGFSKEDTEDLLTDLNALLLSRPHRPQKLMITESAAYALEKILTENKKRGHYVCVGLDEGGQFFLEFLRVLPSDTVVFSHRSVPSVRVFALPLTLCRIGGATIDYRDGRFKLDLPNGHAEPGIPRLPEKSEPFRAALGQPGSAKILS